MRRFTVAMTALMVAACGQDAGTGGRTVSFDLELDPEPVSAPSLTTFETRTGWTVELERAHIALGAVYVHQSGGTAVVQRTLPERVWDVLVPSAHAHPGDNFFYGGEVKGEWLGQVALDVLQPTPVSVGAQPGTYGEVRSLSVLLDPPRASLGEQAEPLAGHHAYVVGTATRADDVVPFEGGLDIADEGNQRRVEGIPFTGLLDDGVTLRLRVHPEVWFEDADFERLMTEPTNEAGRHVISETNQVRSAWFIGARSVRAFSVEVLP